MQRTTVVDLTRSLRIIEPEMQAPEQSGDDQSKDSQEGVFTIQPIRARNVLPTDVGYRSFFGIGDTGRAHNGLAGTDLYTVLHYESAEGKNVSLFLTSHGLFYTSTNEMYSPGDSHADMVTSGALTAWESKPQDVAEFIHGGAGYDPTDPDNANKARLNHEIQATQVVQDMFAAASVEDADRSQHWSYMVLKDDLYLYRSGDPYALRIVRRAASPDGFQVQVLRLNFLDMSQQRGLFRAGGSLGFWDSTQAISVSSVLSPIDSVPDTKTLANVGRNRFVNGSIITVKAFGSGYMIYATGSVTEVRQDKGSILRWASSARLSSVGIQDPFHVAVAQPDTLHFAWTSMGCMQFVVGSDPSPIISDIFDGLRGVYIRLALVGGRFLCVQYPAAGVDLIRKPPMTHVVDPADLYLPAVTVPGAVIPGVSIPGEERCLGQVGDEGTPTNGIKPHAIIPRLEGWVDPGFVYTVSNQSIAELKNFDGGAQSFKSLVPVARVVSAYTGQWPASIDTTLNEHTDFLDLQLTEFQTATETEIGGASFDNSAAIGTQIDEAIADFEGAEYDTLKARANSLNGAGQAGWIQDLITELESSMGLTGGTGAGTFLPVVPQKLQDAGVPAAETKLHLGFLSTDEDTNAYKVAATGGVTAPVLLERGAYGARAGISSAQAIEYNLIAYAILKSSSEGGGTYDAIYAFMSVRADWTSDEGARNQSIAIERSMSSSGAWVDADPIEQYLGMWAAIDAAAQAVGIGEPATSFSLYNADVSGGKNPSVPVITMNSGVSVSGNPGPGPAGGYLAPTNPNSAVDCRGLIQEIGTAGNVYNYILFTESHNGVQKAVTQTAAMLAYTAAAALPNPLPPEDDDHKAGRLGVVEYYYNENLDPNTLDAGFLIGAPRAQDTVWGDEQADTTIVADAAFANRYWTYPLDWPNQALVCGAVSPIDIPELAIPPITFPEATISIPAFEFEQAGQVVTPYALMGGALIYDLQYTKWGTMDRMQGNYLLLPTDPNFLADVGYEGTILDLRPINGEVLQPANAGFYNLNIGVYEAGLQHFHESPELDECEISYGKFALRAKEYTVLESIDVKCVAPGEFSIIAHSSIDGDRLMYGYSAFTLSGANATRATLNYGKMGAWHQMSITGQFNLRELTLQSVIGSRR